MPFDATNPHPRDQAHARTITQDALHASPGDEHAPQQTNPHPQKTRPTARNLWAFCI